MTAWLLPDHIADVLPSQARHIEELRRKLLDTARGYGYELVIAPLMEHLDSLLTGTGEAMDLQTFKLVDQLSGQSLGIRADTTPQAARIDAHLLNRQGVARLCYCGPVLHTHPASARASREPLQLGCELFGHSGVEADLEVLQLAIDALQSAQVGPLHVDLADAALLRAQFAGIVAPAEHLAALHDALARKDSAQIAKLCASFAPDVQRALLALPKLHGGIEVLDEALSVLRPSPTLNTAIERMRMLCAALPRGVQVGIDLADSRGYAYYSGTRFCVLAVNARTELARGGRYDEVGAVFGRNRAAVGFSLDLKTLAAIAQSSALQPAIRAPWASVDHNDSLNAAIARLRTQGHTVVRVLPGHEAELQEFACDRELVLVQGSWAVLALVN